MEFHFHLTLRVSELDSCRAVALLLLTSIRRARRGSNDYRKRQNRLQFCIYGVNVSCFNNRVFYSKASFTRWRCYGLDMLHYSYGRGG